MKSIEPISVIVCCFNSADRLPATLESLARQEANDVSWELVLVDNASTDHTAKKARELWADLQTSVPLKIVREAEPGLTHARLCGVREASYDILGFVDDDNWLDKGWVRLAAITMAENQDIGLLGSGNIEAVFEHPVPEWVNTFAPLLACGSMPGHALQVFERGGLVAGAGMVTRKAVFREILDHYGDFLCSDRKGSNTSSGGDIEFAYVASILGWKIAKHPNLRMQHFIPAIRTQPAYLKKLVVSILQSASQLEPLRLYASTIRTPSFSLLSYFKLLAPAFFYGCEEVLRSIGLGRKSSDHERVVAGTRIAQLRFLLGFFAEYRRNFSKAKHFSIASRRRNRAKLL